MAAHYKPYEIIDSNERNAVGVVAKDLEEMKEKASREFNGKTGARIFDSKNGNEITDDDYLQGLPYFYQLVAVFDGEEYAKAVQVCFICSNIQLKCTCHVNKLSILSGAKNMLVEISEVFREGN